MRTPCPTPLTRLLRPALISLLVLLALAPAAPPARAQQVTVRYAAPSAVGNGDCSSWENACTLQTALSGAGLGAEIWVQRGVHIPGADQSATYQLKALIGVYGGFAGDETELSQRDPAANPTTLSGEIGDPLSFTDNITHIVTASDLSLPAILDGFTITHGYAQNESYGGGAYIKESAAMLSHIHFLENGATYGGGLAVTGSTSALSLNAVTFSGNLAPFGGGIYISGSHPLIMNVTFSGNQGFNGGAIFVDHGAPTLLNLTLMGNSAMNNGGGIYSIVEGDYQMGLMNSILWGNTAALGAQMFSENGSVLVIDNLIQDGCPTGILFCINVITSDPLLSTFGDHGGAVKTIPLLPGSPAIDASTSNTGLVTTDARDVARPQGSAIDYGAYEARPFTLEKTAGDQQSALVGEAFAERLAVSIHSDFGEPVDGGVITFTGPGSGAGATPRTATRTIVNGAVEQQLTANLVFGAYTVSAGERGVPAVNFGLTNTRNASATALAASAAPSTLGQGVTFIATASALAGGRQPGGTVTFSDGETPITGCSDAPVHAGRALCYTAALAHGTHTVHADYAGDVYHAPSSTTLEHTVRASTLTSITSSLNPAVRGQAVTLTITVSAVAPGSGVPTGTVWLYSLMPGNAGRTVAGAAQDVAAIPLVNGEAVYTSATLPAAVHQLLAVYSGDANFAPGESARFQQIVGPWHLYLPAITFP